MSTTSSIAIFLQAPVFVGDVISASLLDMLALFGYLFGLFFATFMFTKIIGRK
jgi:hypothetical protein